MELTLPEIKTITFEILKHFKQFCEEHGIRYFLSNGTLLGAVKYGGFIPWDDDIDVLVPREDYDRLLRLYPEQGRYRLFSMERNPEFRYPFAKLCDMTTVKEETNIDNGVSLGLDIDIFPLDACTAHILRPAVQWRIKLNLIGCNLSKFTQTGDRPFYKKCVIHYCRWRSYSRFQTRLAAIIQRERAMGQTHQGCLIWPVYGAAEVLSAQVFSDTTEVCFEGETFPAPVGYDAYLRSLYRNYKQDPPPEKQKTHHSFRACRR